MAVDIFFCFTTITLITFSVVCICAAANPKYPKRSYGADNWGTYAVKKGEYAGDEVHQ